MNFLNPIAWLFALFIPAVIILYLLKLKRIDQAVSSTLLWRKSIEDLKANTPFQKLKRNLLLLLQLIIITFLVLSLVRPVLELGGLTGQSIVVLIDNSASMSAIDVAPSRLADAKRKAVELVNDMSRGDRMMLVTFNSSAQVLTPFETSQGVLRNAIQGINATDSPTTIEDALRIAESAAEVQPNIELVILSDGNFSLPADSAISILKTRYLPIGTGDDNVAITDLVVRQDFSLDSQYEVLVGVKNFGSQTKDVYIELYGITQEAHDSETDDHDHAEPMLLDAQRFEMDAGTSEQILFDQPVVDIHLIEVRLDVADQLDTDNIAWAVLPENKTTDVLLVSEGNPYLERVLNLDPTVHLSVLEPIRYQGPGTYDLVVFDNFAPLSLVGGNYIFINIMPPLPNWSAGETLDYPMIVDWDRFHPITRYVNLDNLTIIESKNIATPAWVEVLAEARETPLIVAFEQGGIQALVTGFDIYQSNWPRQVSFPVFFTNTLAWFQQGKDVSAFMKKTGEVIELKPSDDVMINPKMIAPDKHEFSLSFSENQSIYFGDTRNAGLYQYVMNEQPIHHYAVNLLSSNESNIQKQLTLQTGNTQIQGTPDAIQTNREIWKTLAIIGFLILCLEWYVYTKRARYAF